MIREITNGISAYFEAWRLAKDHKLWKYFLVPSLISLLLGALVFSTAYYTGAFFFEKIDLWLQSDFFTRYKVIERIIQYLASFLSGALVLLPALFVFKYLVIIINGPFMSPLSEKVEEILLGSVPSNPGIVKWGSSIVRGLRFNLSLLLRELFLSIAISILSLPVGILTPIILFLIQAYFAGRGNMDYVMERYFNYSESLQFSKSNKGVALGNGIPFLLFLYIPIIGFLLAPPLSTIAVTQETLKKIKN